MHLSLLTLRRIGQSIPHFSYRPLWLVKHLLGLTVSLLWFITSSVPARAQPLVKSATNVDPGNTILTGATFSYRLTYTCESTNGPCLNAQIVDLLPPEVQYVSSLPASPTGDIAAINVTSNFMGSGRTRVQVILNNPLLAGNSGDFLINVRFPNGSTPGGTVATNTADAINLGSSPGTFTTPPVAVTGQYTDPLIQPTLALSLTTAPANLDLPESYRLRFSAPNTNGVGNYTSVGPVTVTLPPGTVFNGATPAADCQPGCVGTTPATVNFTAPFSLPITPGSNGDILLNITFPSATFSSGANLTTQASVVYTQLGRSSETLSTSLTHPVTTFVPSPSMGLSVNVTGDSPNPPTLNQTFSYELAPTNNGNVALDNLVVISTLPAELQVISVTTGTYSNVADFAAGVGTRVSYEKNTAPGVFTLWGSSPNTTTNTTLTSPPPGLGAGEYITRIRWEYGQAAVGMSTSTRPLITGRLINPANTGNPVAFGSTIQLCSDLSAVYTPGPTNVSRNACSTFTLSGPFVQFNPAAENISGGGPFNTGQTVSWRLRVRSAAQSSDPVPLADIVVVSLLDEGLAFSNWTFDDQGTGLPAPQNFTQVPGIVIDGKTYTKLIWRWNAGSGNLGVNQQVWINMSTMVNNHTGLTTVRNRMLIKHNSPGLGKRCSGGSQADPADLDGNGDTAETYCYSDGSVALFCPALAATVSSGTAVCTGNTVPIAVSTTGLVTGYQWYKDGSVLTGVASATTATLSLSNVQTGNTGNYSVVVTNGCNSLTSTAFSLSVNALPTPTLTVSPSATLTCANASLTLTAGGGNTYSFSNNATATGVNTATISQAGTYSVIATSSGCSSTTSITISSNTTPPQGVSLSSSGLLTCIQTSVNLTAASSTGGVIYSFSGPGITGTNGATATANQTGSYTVTVTATNGCTATTTTSVTSDTTAPTATLSNTGPITCANSSVTLTAGGGGTYIFSSGATGSGNTATVTQSGTYTVTVTSSMNGCSSFTTTTVQSNTTAPTVTLSNNGPISDNNQNITLTATGGTTYTFSSSATQQGSGNTAIVNTPGPYSVTVATGNGCTATASTTVTGAQNPATVCRNGTAVIKVVASGNPVKYEWYKNTLSSPRLAEITLQQRGTATSSLTLINQQTTANFYVRVTDQNGSAVVYGPIKLTVNMGCVATLGRLAVEEVDLQITLLGNPLIGEQLRATVSGAASKTLHVQLLDLSGKSIRQQSWQKAGSEQNVDWNLVGQASGVYLLQAMTDADASTPAQRHSVKVIKP